MRAFLRRLRIDTNGRHMAAFKKQMLALASCRMQLGYRTADRVVNLKCDPIDQFEAWLQTDDSGQRVMWPGVITLSDKFHATLLEHAVPLDPGAIAKLQNSALALDTYTWLAHRLCRVKKNAGVTLPWSALKDQFGQEYRTDKDFKREMKGALAKALSAYPEAKVETVRGGIKLLPSAPPIKRKGHLVALPAPAAPAPTAAAPALAKALSTPARQFVSDDALDKVRSVAPGWDRQWLLLRYQEWSHGKAAPANIDAAFLGWAKKFTKGKPPT